MWKKWIFVVAMLAAALGSGLAAPSNLNLTNEVPEEVEPLPTIPIEPIKSNKHNNFSLSDAILRTTPFSASYLNVFELIRGRVPGVWIIGGPNFYQVRIRGAMGPPLLVIDGMPFYSRSDADLSNTAQIIPPQDVDRIEIIKNAAGAAMYGRNAGNGVILIYTKRGPGEEIE
mgnify:CR=1 FL=1